MSIKKLQQQLPDYVAWSGVILGAIGQALAIAAPVTIKAVLLPLGLALFMAGIILAIRDVQTRVKELRVENVVLTAQRAVSETGSWMVVNPTAIHVRATSNMLTSILQDYVPRLANNLKQFTTEEALQIEIEDQSPVFGLMYEIARGLPRGAAWLGITLLDDESAWEDPFDSTFTDFRNLMRQRAQDKELSVLRLYYFRSEQAFAKMSNILSDEHDNGIVVRYLIGGRPPPDISLLWWPPRTVGSTVGDAKPIEQVHRQKFVPLCLLDYQTRSGSLLTKLSVRSGKGDNFSKRELVFAEYWDQAKVFPPGG